MAYKFCCDSYHIPNFIYIYYYCNYIMVKYVTRAITWGRCSLIRLLVVMSVVVVLVLLFISFPVDGVGRGVPVHLFFVVCYCFLFWIGCVLSNSAIMESDLFCSQMRATTL